MRITKLTVGLVLAASLGSLAVAESHADPALMAAHETRIAHMKSYGAQMMILGGMAQDKVPYDAAAASAAAAALLALTEVDQSTWWPAGSDSESLGDGRALPAIWENMDDVIAKAGALHEAAVALNDAAGKDLDSLKAAVGAVGGACGACHQAYRKPE